MRQFIPGNTPLVFPVGTTIEYNPPGGGWAMYINRSLNVTWIGYDVQGGTQLMRLPGIRTKFSRDLGDIGAYINQRQATACGQCGD